MARHVPSQAGNETSEGEDYETHFVRLLFMYQWPHGNVGIHVGNSESETNLAGGDSHSRFGIFPDYYRVSRVHVVERTQELVR